MNSTSLSITFSFGEGEFDPEKNAVYDVVCVEFSTQLSTRQNGMSDYVPQENDSALLKEIVALATHYLNYRLHVHVDYVGPTKLQVRHHRHTPDRNALHGAPTFVFEGERNVRRRYIQQALLTAARKACGDINLMVEGLVEVPDAWLVPLSADMEALTTTKV